MRKLLPLLLALIIPLTACGDSSGPSTPSTTGSWTGSTGGATFTLTLTEATQNITGSGSLVGPGASIALTATGTHVHPNVSMIFRAAGYQDLNYQGSFTNDNTIVGTLNGSGFANTAVTFVRR